MSAAHVSAFHDESQFDNFYTVISLSLSPISFLEGVKGIERAITMAYIRCETVGEFVVANHCN